MITCRCRDGRRVAAILQLGGQSTFDGGLTVASGGVAIGASSTPAQGGYAIGSGPLGTGPVTIASGAKIYSAATAAVGNNITFQGPVLFDSVAGTAWTLTLTKTPSLPRNERLIFCIAELPAYGLQTRHGSYSQMQDIGRIP